MSKHYQRTLSLTGLNTADRSTNDLRQLVRNILDAGIHGLSFSPYVEGQGPGTELTEAQIRDRLAVIRPYVRWIRTFSCTDGQERIPAIAAESGLKTMVGVWLDQDRTRNDEELSNATAVANAGNADILAIGNEVLLRGELSSDELIDYMQRARAACPGVPVGYVDAYFQFVDNPNVADACDILLANCYPFWEGCPAEHALLYMKEMYRRALSVADGKPVVISETGWPNIGSATQGAVPSFENAIKYFVDTCRWAEEDGIDVFYFSSFDESWKTDDEGDVGAYWGLWDKDGTPKYF